VSLSDFVPWLLFVHVIGAIIAFGPTFSFQIIGMMGAAEPAHGNFATRVSLAITDKRVEPLAILQGITGALLIWAANFDLGKAVWLWIAIPLYLVALWFALFVQRPLVKKVIAMTSTPPPPGAGGPPPELLAAGRRIGQGGMFLALAVTVIVLLMVVKPTLS
jgi:hypothetical protein